MTEDRDQLSRAVREALDADLGNIDAETERRLARMRYAAVEAAAPRRRATGWLPAGALASTLAVTLVTTLVLSRWPGPGSDPFEAQLLDVELLSASESLELIEDLDFLLWLEAHERSG